ncbi:MAG TPA: methionine--tRNA ligase [Polyangiaceae bacterium]
MARKPFYVTTPIYYVNDVPHLGTAYTTVVADAIRRYHLLRGDDTRMLTGTDEHGLKLEREAKERGQTPKQFVDEMSARFREAWPKLLVEPDDFIRTTEPRHEKLVQWFWERVEKHGDLSVAEYEDWYCVGCESFKTEKELVQPGNQCPVHKKPIEKIKEETYFFRLSKYQDQLLELYEKNPGFIEPESRRNEVISFVKSGLKDLSVSRTSFTWGIPVPGNPKHVMYVWFDALANYWTALGGEGGENARFWPPTGEVVHLVGKDILRFHAVYWPAFLLSAGLPLPSKIFAHGFLTIDGEKMSKSLRNSVDPVRIAQTEELGGPDGLRYQLLRAIAFGQDGDFDHAAMVERYNADLGKNLGNLLSRVLGLCSKLAGGKVPNVLLADVTGADRAFVDDVNALLPRVRDDWEALRPHLALEGTLAISSRANQYVDQAAPWAEAKKGNQAQVDRTLYLLLQTLQALGTLIWPALPRKSDAFRAQLALPPLAPKKGTELWPSLLVDRPGGEVLGTASPLFPTIDKDKEEEILARLVPPKEVAIVVPPQSPISFSLSSSLRDPGIAASEAGLVTYDDFAKVDLRVGLVKTAEKVPKKDKLLKLTVDVGEAEPRTIVAGLALSFAPEALVGKRVVVVANLAPRDFGKGLVSHGMLLATGPSEKLHLATIGDDAEPGAKLK